MKAICISACEVDGFGIVTPGEEIELADGYSKDERIKLHFVLDKKTIKNPDAPIPDFNADKKACRERFAKSLYNETEWWKAVNKLIDGGATIPNEVLDSNDTSLTSEERVERLVELWTESYGWAFPTDPQLKPDKGPKDKANTPPPRNKKGEQAEEKRDDLFDNGK